MYHFINFKTTWIEYDNSDYRRSNMIGRKYNRSNTWINKNLSAELLSGGGGSMTKTISSRQRKHQLYYQTPPKHIRTQQSKYFPHISANKIINNATKSKTKIRIFSASKFFYNSLQYFLQHINHVRCIRKELIVSNNLNFNQNIIKSHFGLKISSASTVVSILKQI